MKLYRVTNNNPPSEGTDRPRGYLLLTDAGFCEIAPASHQDVYLSDDVAAAATGDDGIVLEVLPE